MTCERCGTEANRLWVRDEARYCPDCAAYIDGLDGCGLSEGLRRASLGVECAWRRGIADRIEGRRRGLATFVAD